MSRSITDEIKQTRPFRSRSQEATVALLRTSHLLRRRIDAITDPQGLTSQQYNVLRILRGARAPLPTMEISERMIEPSCGITRLIGALEDRGFVRREQWGGDRRQVLCQITPAGLRAVEKVDDPLNDLDDEIGKKLSSAEIELFLDLLGRIRETLASDD